MVRVAQELVAHLAVTQDAEQLEAAPRIAVRARMHVALRLRQLGATTRDHLEVRGVPVGKGAVVSTCMHSTVKTSTTRDHLEVRGVPIRERRVTYLAVKVLTHGRRWEDEDFGASVQKVIVRNLDHGRGLPGAGSVDNEHPGIRQAAGMAQEGDSLLVALEPRFDRLPYPLDRA